MRSSFESSHPGPADSSDDRSRHRSLGNQCCRARFKRGIIARQGAFAIADREGFLSVILGTAWASAAPAALEDEPDARMPTIHDAENTLVPRRIHRSVIKR